ncbi:MAG: hypothetical protein AB8B85_01965 [Paracoccaceae bacterium]
MFIKRKLAHLHDCTRLALLRRDRASRISLLPVFHVEKLYDDAHHHALCSFLRGYRELTGKRAVITCMTPLSPILAQQMQDAGFSAHRYWDRIAEAAENGIVGLHGHFLRTSLDQGLRPMHYAFHDLDLIRDQIGCELEALRAYGLLEEDRLIYSGGWWFITLGLRNVLAEFGFHWDYSLSSSPFNISAGSAEVDSQAEPETASDGHRIRSAIAVSGLARAGRPFQAIGKILAEAPTVTASETRLSLYSHDYDLHLAPALQMTEHFCQAGFAFHEPEAQCVQAAI